MIQLSFYTLSLGQNLAPEPCRYRCFPHTWRCYIQLTLAISNSLISNNAYLEVKIWSLPKYENLTTCKNIVEKRRNCSSFPQYFQYISNFVQLHIYLLNVVNRISLSSILQIWYVEVRISRSISESPLEFEITRVDCICISVILMGNGYDTLWKLVCRFSVKESTLKGKNLLPRL